MGSSSRALKILKKGTQGEIERPAGLSPGRGCYGRLGLDFATSEKEKKTPRVNNMSKEDVLCSFDVVEACIKFFHALGMDGKSILVLHGYQL